jgi:putative methionine-R-sulfoxide reductase with GAF domain
VGIRDGNGDVTPVVAWSGPTLSTTRSEIVVPILGGGAAVVGSLDVQSDVPDAFSAEDRQCLEACARLVAPLWG